MDDWVKESKEVIESLRKAIRLAEPGFKAVRFAERRKRAPDRAEALQHALWMLDEIQHGITMGRLDEKKTDLSVGCVSGIMLAYGIDTPEGHVHGPEPSPRLFDF